MKELAAKISMSIGVFMAWFADVFNHVVTALDNHSGGIGAVVAIGGWAVTTYYKRKAYRLAQKAIEEGRLVDLLDSQKGG